MASVLTGSAGPPLVLPVPAPLMGAVVIISPSGEVVRGELWTLTLVKEKGLVVVGVNKEGMLEFEVGKAPADTCESQVR